MELEFNELCPSIPKFFRPVRHTFSILFFILLNIPEIFSAVSDSLHLEIKFSPSSGAANFAEKIAYRKYFTDTFLANKEIRKAVYRLFEEGYITATVDSMKRDSVLWIVYTNPGSRYLWAFLKPGNVDETILNETGYRERIFWKQPFRYTGLKTVLEKILVYCENHGYPFSAIQLDSIEINCDTIAASLLLKKNKKIVIDSVIVRGNAEISSAYLHNHLGIKPGDLYNESLIGKIDPKLKEIPFLRNARPSNVIFNKDETKLFLFCDKRDASRFDGILGVLPNSQTNGKLLLTGDVNLKFLNTFHHGEALDFNWRKLQENTHNLKTHLNFPFVFSTPFGADLKFGLYRKDTVYVESSYSAGVQYLFTANNYVQGSVEKKESNLISNYGLSNLTALPPYADVSAVMYGLGYRMERLDYRFNPRKGFALFFSGSAGNKTIRKNPKINPELYEKLDLAVSQYVFTADADVFFPLRKQSVLKTSFRGGYFYSKNIFLNELFRIGGMSVLRGFDEESIYATSYAVGTLEYRFLLEQNSYLFAFFDGAYYENLYLKRNSVAGNPLWRDHPAGTGAGISFETKAGIFSVSYAVGKQFDNPVQLRNAKIHFGVVNYF